MSINGWLLCEGDLGVTLLEIVQSAPNEKETFSMLHTL